MSKFCPNCGKPASDQDTFCVHCGQPLDDTQVAHTHDAPQMGQPQSPQYGPQPSQPVYYQQPRQNNIVLYVVIAVLVCLLIGGGVFFLTQSNKDKTDKEAQATEQTDQLKEEINNLKQETADAKASAQKATEAANAKVVVKQHAAHAAEHRAVSAGGGASSGTPKVVINGSGVRMRFAPSLDAGYLTWPNGATRAPKKGARLTYVDENSDWYMVYYLGETFYVSKEYSYLEY